MLQRGTIVIWLLALWASCARGAEPITIVLHSGQSLTGLVDAQTDDQRLWMRFQRGGIMLRRPFEYGQLTHALVGGLSVSPSELRQRSAELRSAAPPRTNAVRAPKPQAGSDVAAPRDFRPGPPANFRIEAATANWDSDVEADGLLLTAIVEDAAGELVSVAGTLTVELIGQPLGVPGLMSPGGVTRLQNYPVLANWTRQVVADQAGVEGYTFRLEYQALHPDFNLEVGVQGLVHARLFVPGTGTLDASTSTIALRQMNPIRDQWQMQMQGRFFPQEQTGRGKQLP